METMWMALAQLLTGGQYRLLTTPCVLAQHTTGEKEYDRVIVWQFQSQLIIILACINYGIESIVSIKGSQNAVAQTKQNFSHHGNSPDVASQDIGFLKFMAGWATPYA